METFAAILEDIQKWITAKVEVVHIILTGIDNDIYSIVDACPNATETWKAIERLKQGESINVQDLKINLYWEFGKFTSQEVNVQFLLQLKPEWQRSLAATRYRGKAIANSHPPTYNPKPEVVADDDASSKDKEIDKLMDLISMSFKNIYKPTNNNLRTSLNTNNLNVDNTLRSNRGTGYARQTRQYDNQREVKEFGHLARECQKPKRAHDLAYHKEKMLICKQEEARIQLSAKHVDWRDDIDDEPEYQELEAHYMFMAKIQEVTPDAVDNSRPIFDAEPLQKVHNSDNGYNVFANERHHPKQPESINDTYLMEQGVTPRQGGNARRNKNGYHHNIMVSTIEKSK
ncbi:hypothetical protein Tco_0861136 [Tanacetum coccineum]|uniref:Uncharacterized protein n=1 Tax=Tanacetum coccineum TaxID=301880 RepID=A0ABQ5BML7_9ASTR